MAAAPRYHSDMTNPVGRVPTYADLLALPEDVRAEIIRGQIVPMPAPRPSHSKAQGALRRFLGGPFDDDDGHDGPGGWWIFIEVDIQLGAEVVRPDLAGWRRERLVEPDVRPIAIAPDWVCEVLSPSNQARDRVTKQKIYAEHGVTHYWIVDPEARTLEAFSLREGQWVVAAAFDESEEHARIAPFEAVEVPISRLFLPKKPEPGP
jgi:Uma2 family endonuclease